MQINKISQNRFPTLFSSSHSNSLIPKSASPEEKYLYNTTLQQACNSPSKYPPLAKLTLALRTLCSKQGLALESEALIERFLHDGFQFLNVPHSHPSRLANPELFAALRDEYFRIVKQFGLQAKLDQVRMRHQTIPVFVESSSRP